MRLTVDLSLVQIDLIRVVGLEVELPVADQTLEARLVVDVALDGPDSLQSVYQVAATQALGLLAAYAVLVTVYYRVGRR